MSIRIVGAEPIRTSYCLREPEEEAFSLRAFISKVVISVVRTVEVTTKFCPMGNGSGYFGQAVGKPSDGCGDAS